MMLQQQLERPQTVPVWPLSDVPGVVDLGVLGNGAIQAPRILGSEDFAPRFRIAGEVASPMIERAEASELDWLEENAQELGHYPGEWLLIHEHRLLVHSRNFAELRVAIRERRIDSPFVYYVPTEEEANSISI